MKHSPSALLVILLGLLMGTCGKEELPGPVDPPVFPSENGVLISNEGGFGFNNASLSFYQFDNQQLNHQVFETANNRKLGDVLQSATFHEDQLYLILNNSSKIEVVDPQTFALRNTIDTFNSPRFLLPVNTTKAYVSDLYQDAIYIVDLAGNRISGQIPLRGWAEEMVLFQEKVFISNRESDQVFVLDSNTDLIVDSIQVRYNSSNILLDKNDRLWVYCSGDAANNERGGLFRINPSTNVVEAQFLFNDFEVGAWPRMAFNGSRDTLYYLKEGLYQFPISNSTLSDEPFIEQGDRIFYALGIRPSTGTIFLGDAIDYQQRGQMLQYNAVGEELLDLSVGIIPNGFYFY